MKYCIDQNVDEPIMLIDKHIGFDAEDGEGILGAEFSRELLFLDTLGKKRIQIWINSPGGLVTEGMQIYNTILKTNTKVDTYNMGICASIAAVIFEAGRTRCMADYSNLMIHNPFNGDDKSLDVLRESIVKMISQRCGLTESETAKLMAEETWLTAQEALNLKMCDEIESSDSYNRPRTKTTSTKDSWKEYSKVLNKIVETKKIIPMKKVTNRLKLNDAANEDAILEAIDKIELNAKNSVDALAKMEKEAKEAKDKYDTLNDAYNKMKDEAAAKEKAEKEAKEAKDVLDAQNKAETLVSDAVKAFKIENKTDVIDSYKKLAVKDYDGTKAIIDNLAVNRKGANTDSVVDVQNISKEAMDARPSIDIKNPQSFVNAMNVKKFVASTKK